MATLTKQDYEYGRLSIDKVSSGKVEVFYIPHEDAISLAKSRDLGIVEFRVKILEISEADNSITMYPIWTNPGGRKYLEQKYHNVSAITLLDIDCSLPADASDVKEILSNIPPNFTKDYDFGLVLNQAYRFVIDAIEDLSVCSRLRVGKSLETGIDPLSSEVFNISNEDFNKAVQDLDLTTSRSSDATNKVKTIKTYNLFAVKVGKEELPMKIHRIPITNFLSRAAQDIIDIDEEEQNLLLSSMSSYTEQIARSEPAKLAKLSNEIELVTLEVLISKFSKMLLKKHAEDRWQDFFNCNPFILSMAFGYPIVKIQSQASVGGRKISGRGDKITDFLVKNNLTNNTALIEIKTPHTTILNKKPYRDSVFVPSGDFVASINQALDQKYHFQKEISQIKENDGNRDLETYSVHCCLIIGKLPEEESRKNHLSFFVGTQKRYK